MDPLSLTASIIAVLGLAAQTLKGLRNLYALRHAPREILELTNEVSQLQALLALVQRAIDGITPDALLPGDRVFIEKLIEGIYQPLKTLDGLIASCGSSGETSTCEDGKGSSRLIVSLTWLKSKKSIEQVREGFLRAHLNVNTALAALNNIHRQEDYRLLVNVHDLLLNQVKATEKDMHINIMPVVFDTAVADYSMTKSVGSTRQPLQEKLNIFSPNGNKQSGSDCSARLRASMGKGICYPTCPCKCHVQKNIESPKWIAEILGSLFYSCTGGLQRQLSACSYTGCQRRESVSYRLTYYFPQWMMMSAITFAACRQGLGGLSGTWSIGFPRAISASHDVWRFIEQGQYEKFLQILREGVIMVNDMADDDGTSLLLFALKFRSNVVVELLLDQGANPHMVDPRGISTCAYAQSSCIIDQPSPKPSWLYKMGIPLLENTVTDDLCFTPLHIVVVGFENVDLYKQLRLNNSSINTADSLGRPPLHWAVIKGNTSALVALLAHGASPNTFDKERMTPLHDVCQAPQTSQADCARLLIDAGADINARDSWGRTPLRIAVSITSTDFNFIEILIQEGAYINTEDIYGQTPLIKSIRANSRATRLLLRHGANIEATDVYSNTALSEAIFRNRPEQLQLLLKYGAKTDQLLEPQYGRRTRQGNANILHLTAWYGGIGIMKVLEGTEQRLCPCPNPIEDFEQNRELRPSCGEDETDQEREAFIYLLSTVRYID